MITTFTGNIAEFDPVTAATWASSVSDENQRRSAVQNILYGWSKNDKPAAQQWLARQTSLSKQDFDSFQQQINNAK